MQTSSLGRCSSLYLLVFSKSPEISCSLMAPATPLQSWKRTCCDSVGPCPPHQGSHLIPASWKHTVPCKCGATLLQTEPEASHTSISSSFSPTKLGRSADWNEAQQTHTVCTFPTKARSEPAHKVLVWDLPALPGHVATGMPLPRAASHPAAGWQGWDSTSCCQGRA